jgi:hypothetical protein
MPEDSTQRLDRLESIAKRQQERLKQQQKRLEQQAATLSEQRNRLSRLESDDTGEDSTVDTSSTTVHPDPDGSSSADLFSRRSLLQGAMVLGLGRVATGAATATEPRGTIGSNRHPVQRLFLQTLTGPLTDGADLTSLTGNALTVNSGSLSIKSDAIDSAELASDSVTIAGNTVSLGASTPVDYVDLADTGDSFPIPNSDLESKSVTIASNQVSLGESSAISHNDLSNIGSGDHHTRPSAGDGLVGGGDTFSVGLSQVGSGTGVLDDVSSDGIEYRSLTGADSITISENNGTISVGLVGSQSNVANTFQESGVDVSTTGDAEITSGTITLSGTNGEAFVEWSRPNSVSRWETVAFDTERNGEQLDVYVQTSSDSGNSWEDWDFNSDGNADPIAPGTDLSSIPPDDRVRFRVSLASESSNKPRLTNLIRQWRG